jgi:hypothetical protein
VKYVQYARLPAGQITSILRALYNGSKPVLFLRDLDSKPCPGNRRDEVVTRYPELQPEQVHVVVREIECWYAAGLDRDAAQALGIRWSSLAGGTEQLDKEKIHHACNFRGDVDHSTLLIQMLDSFSLAQAKRANPSFRRFVQRLASGLHRPGGGYRTFIEEPQRGQ